MAGRTKIKKDGKEPKVTQRNKRLEVMESHNYIHLKVYGI